jgi:hypothetical protein
VIIRVSRRQAVTFKITPAALICYTGKPTNISDITPETASRNWRRNMAKRSDQREKEIVSAAEIPAEVIGAVVLADLAQIEADAATHPDGFARDRIIKAVTRLRDIAQGNVSGEMIEQTELAIA